MKRLWWKALGRHILADHSDSQLLERYARERADEAFALLVSRYCRLVWGQCRRLLANDADADDAFQATFLVLARSPGSVRGDAPLGPWLYGVAYRVCQNARRARARRMRREATAARPVADQPVADAAWQPAYAAAVEEVRKLPETQRAVFVLCEIEGLGEGEAAAILGQKVGTVSSRFARARKAVADRLAQRGISAGALALGGAAATGDASAALVERTISFLRPGATVPGAVQLLTKGVPGMITFKTQLVAIGLLAAAGVSTAIGSGWFAPAAPPSHAATSSKALLARNPLEAPPPAAAPPATGAKPEGLPDPFKPAAAADDEFRKLRIEHHNALDAAARRFDERLAGGVYHMFDHLGLHCQTLEKLVKARLELEPDVAGRLRALELFTAHAKKMERFFVARHEVDDPLVASFVSAYRADVESQWVALKKAAEPRR